MTSGTIAATAAENRRKNAGNVQAAASSDRTTETGEANESPTAVKVAGASTTRPFAPSLAAAARNGPGPSVTTDISAPGQPSPTPMQSRITHSAPPISPTGSNA